VETLLTVIIILLKIVAILAPLLLGVAYLTFAERKIIGYMQVRIGPNRVGPKGWLQPIADAMKLMFKEIIIPTKADRFLFLLAPVVSFGPALAAWAVIPFGDGMMLSHLDAGMLYLLALTSLGVYGVIIAGWSSNSMVFEFQVCLSRRDAFGGPDRIVRNCHGFCLGGRTDGGWQLESKPDRAGPAGQSVALVLVAAATVVSGVFHFWGCRNQSRTFRRGRGRVGNRGRLSCGLFRHGIRGILPGGIRQYDPGIGAGIHDVPRWLAVAVRGDSSLGISVRFCAWRGLAGDQDFVLAAVFLVVPRHFSSLSLRPDHAAGMEGLYSSDAGMDFGDRFGRVGKGWSVVRLRREKR